jgi:hypothetical protein
MKISDQIIVWDSKRDSNPQLTAKESVSKNDD